MICWRLLVVLAPMLTILMWEVIAQSGIPPRDIWCVAMNNAADSALQTAIDWACGPGAANCAPIQKGGPCYSSTDFQQTASWAFNDYYLKNGLTNYACNFSGTAAVSSLDPSMGCIGFGKCKFPSSLSASNGSLTVMGPPKTSMGSRVYGAGSFCFSLLLMPFIL